MKRAAPLFAGLALAVAAFAGFFAATDTSAAIDRVTHLLAWLRNAGPVSWLGFVLLQAVVATVGILPASLLSVAAGMAFGLPGGFLLSALGNLLGAWVAFRLSRSLLRPWIAAFLQRYCRLALFDEALGSDNWRFVALVRVSPVMPFSLTSYALGLTRIDLRAYMLGTLASFPALLAYVAIGAFAKVGLDAIAGQMGFVRSIALGIGGIAIVATSLYLRRILMRALTEEAAPLPASL